MCDENKTNALISMHTTGQHGSLVDSAVTSYPSGTQTKGLSLHVLHVSVWADSLKTSIEMMDKV